MNCHINLEARRVSLHIRGMENPRTGVLQDHGDMIRTACLMSVI